MEILAEEELLLARCLRRDPEALKILMERTSQPAYSFLVCVLEGNENLSRAILIQSVAKTLRRVTPFDEQEPFLVDLMKLVVAEIHLVSSKQKEPNEKASRIPVAAGKPEMGVIATALSHLALKEKIVLLLRDQMDFSIDEIAFIISVPAAHLKTILAGARQAFRHSIGEILGKK